MTTTDNDAQKSKKLKINNKSEPPAAGTVRAHKTQITVRAPAELKPWEGNPRIHNEKQLVALAASIKKLGFRVPIITNEEGVVLAGHGRLEVAKRLGLAEVPTIVATGMSKTEQRAFVLSDNKLAQLSQWDKPLLLNEVQLLLDDGFHIEMTGFSTAEVDLMIDGEIDPEVVSHEDLHPEDMAKEPVVARRGDIWCLDQHRLYCGDATEMSSYGELMQKGELAQMCLTDPPYNVKVNGHVCGSGKTKHEEFAMASGEMSSGEFTDFLAGSCANIASYCQEGAIVFCFMDWRHMREMLDAGEKVFGKPRQLCVWSKDNAGMGTFYRSQHELVFVFRHGDAAHINNFELGQHGRYRSNVWNYPGVNTFTGKGFQQLALHPTVKPVSLVADAIRDCSHRKGIVLDPFAGSGTILVAAERTGRMARAIEYEPKYVDVAIIVEIRFFYANPSCFYQARIGMAVSLIDC
ncbi:MAG TPA: DNA methylase N-4 [Rhodospirillaceae bacterium]|nr:DNA methylase N-4 [Rhodospirillaceae bacterium]